MDDRPTICYVYIVVYKVVAWFEKGAKVDVNALWVDLQTSGLGRCPRRVRLVLNMERNCMYDRYFARFVILG